MKREFYIILRLETKLNTNNSQILVRVLCNKPDSIFKEYFDYSYIDEGSYKYWMTFKSETLAREYILRNQLKNCIVMFYTGEFRNINENVNDNIAEEESLLSDVSIDELDFSPRTYNCLRSANIQTVSELKAKSSEELANIRNLGRKCLEEIKEKLAAHGM